MKRKAALFLCALLLALLCGCSRLVPDEYMQVTPHSPETKTQEQADVLTVSNYKTLKNALRSLVQNGVEHGVLHASQYDGDIETDLPQAAYEIARVDPIGAYAIDYITHDCTLIVTYYEICVDITFRDMLTPLSTFAAHFDQPLDFIVHILLAVFFEMQRHAVGGVAHPASHPSGRGRSGGRGTAHGFFCDRGGGIVHRHSFSFIIVFSLSSLFCAVCLRKFVPVNRIGAHISSSRS